MWVRTVSCLELESSNREVKDTVDVGDVVIKTGSETAVDGVVIGGVVYAGVIYSGVAGMVKDDASPSNGLNATGRSCIDSESSVVKEEYRLLSESAVEKLSQPGSKAMMGSGSYKSQ